jgi:hypothetical protein
MGIIIKVELDSNDPLAIMGVSDTAKSNFGKIKDLSGEDGQTIMIYEFENPEMALAFKQAVIPLPGVSSANGQEEGSLQPQRQQVLPTPGRKMTKNRKKNTLWRIEPPNDGQGGP